MQLAILLKVIGEEVVEVFNTFDLLEADSKYYQKVMDAFEGYAKPQQNVVIGRRLFNRCQEEGEQFDVFLT